MPARANVAPHAYLDYQIDELCLIADHAVYAFGEAGIAYDRDGNWEIATLRVDVVERPFKTDELPRTHLLYQIIITALHELSAQDIDDRVADALARERECV